VSVQVGRGGPLTSAESSIIYSEARSGYPTVLRLTDASRPIRSSKPTKANHHQLPGLTGTIGGHVKLEAVCHHDLDLVPLVPVGGDYRQLLGPMPDPPPG
jgi:hypothetical protein